MGGTGGSLNVFKFDRRGDPKETLNWRLWLAVLTTCMISNGRGVDEGMIGGILSKESFQNLLHFEQYNKHELADVKANISSISQLGSLAGTIIAFLICDRIGRVWAIRQTCVLWIFGVILFLTNAGRLGQVYAGKFITGISFGESLVVMPIYLSEVAPKSVRGLCLALFGANVYPGLMLAQFTNLGTERNLSPASQNQWILPASLHLVFAGICLILSIFVRESPRFLVKSSLPEAAHANLAYIRNLHPDHPYVISELHEITTAYDAEQEIINSGDHGWSSYLREMFLLPNNLYPILVGMGIQMFSFWSGSATITLYAPDFFALLGKTSEDDKLFTTAMLGVVKVASAFMSALFLVDVIGRKRSLVIGVSLQSVSMLFIALYLSIVATTGGESTSQKHAATVAIVMIYVGAFGFALGWNLLMYFPSETLPLRIRAASSSLIMTFHYLNQYATSKVSPLMLLPRSEKGLGPAGTFWFFFVVIIVGGLWAWFFIPETSGMGLEKTENLFRLKWYQIGRYGRKDADERSGDDLRLSGSSEDYEEGKVVVTKTDEVGHLTRLD